VSQLPSQGPVRIAIPSAGVLVTAVYAGRSAGPVKTSLAGARVLATARQAAPRLSTVAPAAPMSGVRTPGSYQGRGFDACTAPSQSAMNAWRASAYRAVGVYIGGINRGCGQPNLTAAWVSQQVSSGWHLIPTYVGLQAPCTRFSNRMSYDPGSARAQGRAEAHDAVAQAHSLGITRPSTVYSDVEGYNNTSSSCVTAVMNYVSGWTHVLHANGYKAGVYSSGSSGISDMSVRYTSSTFVRPDHIWLAWWNDRADVYGGSYVAATQWSNHQRIHQYAGNVSESYGGYRINIDRDYLDVGSVVAKGRSCPTNLNFSGYHKLRPGARSPQVLAAQCLLSKRGFDPGAATGTVGSATAAAINAFKASVGLASNSVLSRRGWTALLSAGHTPVLQAGSTGRGVRKLQRSLTAALRSTVPVTGTLGSTTRRAVIAYKTAHGLSADAIVGVRTWRTLQRAS
jgi:Rv2525c-like, glycoside hydrolase-like domain/Putative peptidoglycan binding domain